MQSAFVSTMTAALAAPAATEPTQKALFALTEVHRRVFILCVLCYAVLC